MLKASNNSPVCIIGNTAVANDILCFLSEESISARISSFEQAQQQENQRDYQYIVAVVKNQTLRRKIVTWLQFNSLNCPTYIHPRSYVMHPDNIGAGTVIGPMTSVYGVVGEFCFLAPGCHISHNSRLDDGCVCLTKSTVCGSCYVAPGTVLQPSAIILDKVQIKIRDVNILPAAVITKDIESVGTYGGNPARKVNSNSTIETEYFQ